MSETPAAPAPETEAGAAAPQRPKAVVMIGVILLGLAAGAGGGVVLAPRLLAAPAKADSTAESHGGEARGKEGSGRIVRLDNLIVNPAGSEGSRFLMASVAFEVETESAEKALKDREVQLRDQVVTTLESQTMQQLTQPFARDSLKRQIGRAVTGLLGPKTAVTVYLPQFVIQ
jgi:flagellar FliL protein